MKRTKIFFVSFFLYISSLCGETWSSPQDLSTAGQNSSVPTVAISSNGKVVTAWVCQAKIQASDSTFPGAWSTPTTLQSPLKESAFRPIIKINSSDHALLTWGGSFIDSPEGGAFTSSLFWGTAWSEPISIWIAATYFSPDIAINDSDQCVSLLEYIYGHTAVLSSKWYWGGGWSQPTALSLNDREAAQGKLALNNSGAIVAVWQQKDGTDNIIYGQSSSYHGFWPVSYPTNGAALSARGQNAKNPAIALNDSFQAIAVWVRSNGIHDIIQAATFTIGFKWSSPSDLSAPFQSAAAPQIAINDSGQAVAVWSRSNGLNTIIQASTLTYGGSWSAPIDLSATGEDASSPQLAINNAGQVVVVWKRSNGLNTIIQATTCNFGQSWSTPVDLSELGQNATSPQVALNSLGQAAVVWSRSNGLNTIIQASTTSLPPLPPVNLSGLQKGYSGHGWTKHYNRILWNASPSENVTHYKLYRNGTLIATIPKTEPFRYEDLDQPHGAPETYEVSAFINGAGESTKASIVIP